MRLKNTRYTENDSINKYKMTYVDTYMTYIYIHLSIPLLFNYLCISNKRKGSVEVFRCIGKVQNVW